MPSPTLSSAGGAVADDCDINWFRREPYCPMESLLLSLDVRGVDFGEDVVQGAPLAELAKLRLDLILCRHAQLAVLVVMSRQDNAVHIHPDLGNPAEFHRHPDPRAPLLGHPGTS